MPYITKERIRMIKMNIMIGDWSRDGHNQFDKVLIESNHKVFDMQQAYKASCRLTGIQFHDSPDYAGIGYEYPEDKKCLVCVNYHDSSLTPECISVFKKHGIPNELILEDDECRDEGYSSIDGTDHLIEILMWFIKLSLKDLKYKVIKDDVPYFNGFWNDNLNVTIGYGLYYD